MMKENILKAFFIVVIFVMLVCPAACMRKDNSSSYKGIYEGIYGASSQIQEMENPESSVPSDREPPPYGQYEFEREEMIKE